MDRTSDYPAPPLPNSDERKWISLRQAASEWARLGDRDENQLLELMMASFWLGEFEKEGSPRLFTFEVPAAYAQKCKKVDVAARLGARLTSQLCLEDQPVALNETGWVLKPEDDTQALPIVVVEEDVRGNSIETWLIPQYRLDQFGELWITTADGQGKTYEVAIQQRDKRYHNRSNVLGLLAVVHDIRMESALFFEDSAVAEQIRSAHYAAMAKRPISAYSERAHAQILSRLHVHLTDLQEWSRRQALPFPFEPDTRKSNRQRPPRRYSETAIKDALKDYIKQTDNPIQAAAVRYVKEMCKGAPREIIRKTYNDMVPEPLRRPGRTPHRRNSRPTH